MAYIDRTKVGWGHRFLVVFGSSGLTMLCFSVLPVLQFIAKGSGDRLDATQVDTYYPPQQEPPPPEPEPEKEPEEKPPELKEQMAPLDLSQLELAMNPGLGGGWLAGDFGVNLGSLTGGGKGEGEGLFSELDLDQKPKAVFQVGPQLTPDLRRKTPATVILVFDVTPDGRVENPSVFRSSDPAFEGAAVNAIRQWRFEPGKRNNEPVGFRMRMPMTFPKSR
ncbi:MAG: energy transducer TonB [Planctomycetes bacterium]|nr:energy transducer TonB [Planctomycetota bacterium]